MNNAHVIALRSHRTLEVMNARANFDAESWFFTRCTTVAVEQAELWVLEINTALGLSGASA
jgi:hypothetical protein